MQGRALDALWSYRGLYLSASVGAGKTLIAWLAFALFESRRGVFCAPAGLLEQVRRMWLEYAGHWLSPVRMPTRVSYEELDRESGANLLDRLDPDVLVLDEAHSTRRWERTATKRIHRALDTRPDTPVVCMTATPGRMSIMDHWHHLVWCLGDQAPVPLVRSEATQWAAALDHGGRDYAGPGALALGSGRTAQERARAWYRDRLTETPGVIIHSQDSCDKKITIRQVVPPQDPVLEEHFRRFRTEFETPGGETVSDPLGAYRLEVELGAGYYGVWDPPPPRDWLRARRAWRDFARRVCDNSQRSKRPIETEAQVASLYPDEPRLIAWRKIRDTYRISPKPVWCSASVVEWAARWARGNSPCLVWAWGVPTCEAIACASGLTHYGRRGLSSAGKYIGDADTRRSAVVSGGANMQGRDLPGWHRALYLQPPQSAQWLEQAFGRMHRSRQVHDVDISVAITSMRVADGVERAIGESEFGRETWGANQKILRAQIERATLPVDTYRWC